MQWIYGEIFMEINRLSGYSDFLGIVEYPAVVFCEDGEVISINNAAVKIVGSDVESIAMEPDKFMVSDEFWPTSRRAYGERDTYLRTYLSMDIQMAISTVGWWDSATCSLRVIMTF